MTWLRNFWMQLSGAKNAVLEAENARLIETNAVLEEENFALRSELRATVNSLLSGAGVAPLPAFEQEKPKPIQRIRRLTLHQRQQIYPRQTLPKEKQHANETRS